MGVTNSGNIFRAGPKLHRHHTLGNQLAGHGANDMHAQDFVGRSVGQHFDHAGGVTQRPCPTIGHEWEGASLVGTPRGFQLLFGLTDPGYLGVGVNHPRDGVEVDVAMLARNALCDCDAFFLGLVRQHRAAHHVADGPDVGQISFALAIDHNGTALVELQPHFLRRKTNGVGHPTNRHDQLVHFKRLGLTLGVGPGDGHAFFPDLDFADFGAELDIQTLLDKGFVRFLGNLLIDRPQKHRQSLQHSHLGTQTAPDRPHLQADHARADQSQLFGHSGHAQGTVIGQNVFLVERRTRQGTRIGACGHNNVFARNGFFGSTGDLDVIQAILGRSEGAAAVEKRDLVLFEQVHNAVVVLFDDGILAAQHFRQIQTQASDLDTVLGKVVAGMVVMLGRLEQSLGRNAANVGAGATQCGATLGVFPFVDTGHIETKLGCANGGNITARTATDDDHVKLFGHARLLRCQTTGEPDLPALLSSPPGRARLRGRPRCGGRNSSPGS